MSGSTEALPASKSAAYGSSIWKDTSEEKKRRLVCQPIDFSDLPIAMGLSFSSRGLNKITVSRGRMIDGQIVLGEPRVMNRPYIHLYVQAEKGCFKSAHARALMRQFPEDVLSQDYVSGPGLRGTIDEDQNFVPPLIFNWATKCVVMDEVVRDRHGETTRMFLQMLEGNHYTYKLGRSIKDDDSRHHIFVTKGEETGCGKDLFEKTGAFWNIRDSNVEIYAPFTLMMMSMYPLSFTLSSRLGEALLDRMFTVTYTVSPQQRKDVEDGFYKFDFPIYTPPSEVEIDVDEYLSIVILRDILVTNKQSIVSGSRVLDNMIRAYAVVKPKYSVNSEEMIRIFQLITKMSGAYWE